MKMQKVFSGRLSLFAVLPLVASCSLEQKGTDAEQESSETLQAEMIADLNMVGNKYVALAEATPEEHFSWRPDEQVRTVSEVYMHIVMANMMIARGVTGVEVPEEIDATWYGGDAELIVDKATIVPALRTSFDFATSAIEVTSNEQLSEMIELFGTDQTVRSGLLLLVTHAHEHLGQAIAYARTNGVTPPWSAGG